MSVGRLRHTIQLHLLGDAMVDDYVGQPGDVFRSDAGIFNASQKECGKANDKSYCATQNV